MRNRRWLNVLQGFSGFGQVVSETVQLVAGYVVAEITASVPLDVKFPKHLHVPETAKSLDLKRLEDVAAGETTTLIDFTCPPGSVTRILYYGLFNDGLLAADFDFIPTVNAKRLYPFHGDSLLNNRLYLGVAPDLSNESLIHGFTQMQAGQRLVWQAVNRSVLPATMGVRVMGYVDTAQSQETTTFGG